MSAPSLAVDRSDGPQALIAVISGPTPKIWIIRFMERYVPVDHLLRAIDRVVDLSGLRARLRPFYGEIARPSTAARNRLLQRYPLAGTPRLFSTAHICTRCWLHRLASQQQQ